MVCDLAENQIMLHDQFMWKCVVNSHTFFLQQFIFNALQALYTEQAMRRDKTRMLFQFCCGMLLLAVYKDKQSSESSVKQSYSFPTKHL